LPTEIHSSSTSTKSVFLSPLAIFAI
jgi:hypothetical protein